MMKEADNDGPFHESQIRLCIIVDDDPAVRDALSVVFSLEGFDVETFPKRR
jgi:FixJ family two-component response regulator